MSNAAVNRLRVRSIRHRMSSGEITYVEAKAEAQPIIDDINATSAKLAKKYGLPNRKMSFAVLMR